MAYPFHHNANYRLFKIAQENRKHPTPAEELLWQRLRKKQQLGKKFRRQHPLSTYVVDFYCHECLLVVEADGPIHLSNDNPSYDKNRTEFLNNLGILVLRFTNDEILQDIESVLRTIRKHLS